MWPSALSVTLLLILNSSTRANVLMGKKSELQVIDTLHAQGRITQSQRDVIVSFVELIQYEPTNDEAVKRTQTCKYEALPGLVPYLQSQVQSSAMEVRSYHYVMNLFHLPFETSTDDERGISGISSVSLSNPVSANYDTENSYGIVNFLGIYRRSLQIVQIAQQGFNLGIWGYAKGDREYVLQGTASGLRIVDVTVPSKPIGIQFIRMNVGYYIWRDVVTYEHTDGKTYAYVHAQTNIFLPFESNLHVVDLSYLSGSSWFPNIFFPPIPFWAKKQISGYTDLGHTIHAQEGFLFVNAQTIGIGTLIFDLSQDPWNPKQIAQAREGDGHDVYVRAGITVSGRVGDRIIMIVSDGNEEDHVIYDLTDIRSDFASANEIVQLSTSSSHYVSTVRPPVPGNFAHSSVLTEDGNTLYVVDENNLFDVACYDVSDMKSPTLVGYFQWPGDGEFNVRIHNIHIRGTYLFAAYYSAGFRVFDITDPRSPVEVGRHETWRDPFNTGVFFTKQLNGDFTGAWNLYPSLPSGRILVSDTEQGTFVFSVDGSEIPCDFSCWVLKFLDFFIFWN